MRNTVTWLSILLELLSSGYAQNWCHPKFDCVVAGVTRKHIMCEPLPRNDVCTALSYDKKSHVLRLHNEVRKGISTEEYARKLGLPKACPMSELIWDDRLALMAEKAGRSCLLNMNPCRSTVEFKKVAQCYEAVEIQFPFQDDPVPLLDRMFSKWMKSLYLANEAKVVVKNFAHGSWDCGAQVLWAGARKIGCSVIRFHLVRPQRVYQALICNYGPSGNIPGKNVYPTDCSKPKLTRTTSPTTTAPTTTISTTSTTSTASTTSTTTTTTTTSTTNTSSTTSTTEKPESDPIKQHQHQRGCEPASNGTTAEVNEEELPFEVPTIMPVVAVHSSHEMKPNNLFLLGHMILILLTLNQ